MNRRSTVGGDPRQFTMLAGTGEQQNSGRSIGSENTKVPRSHAHLHLALSQMAAELNAKRLPGPVSHQGSRAPSRDPKPTSLAGSSSYSGPSGYSRSRSLSPDMMLPNTDATRAERDRAKQESSHLQQVVEGLQAELARWQSETTFWKECAVTKG